MERKYFDVAFLGYDTVIAAIDFITEGVMLGLEYIPGMTSEIKAKVVEALAKLVLKEYFGKRKSEFMAEYLIYVKEDADKKVGAEKMNISVHNEITEMINYKKTHPIEDDTANHANFQSAYVELAVDLGLTAIKGVAKVGVTVAIIYEALEIAWSATNLVNAFVYESENQVFGSSGNDEILGGHEGDILRGGAGGDIINGYSGNDRIYGMSEYPEILDTPNSVNILNGGSGGDTIIGGSSRDIIFGDNEIERAEDYGKNDPSHSYYVADRYDSAQYKELNAKTFNNGGLAVNTDDHLYGGKGTNIIFGNEGNDEIFAGNDDAGSYVYGGSGEDEIKGSIGDDKIYGGEDKDTIDGNYGDDYIFGERGNDELHGGDGADTIVGGAGTDEIYGDDDDDYLYGDFIDEERKGDNGDTKDYIYGGDGDDHIYGGGGDDKLYGDDDNDSIVGGSGSDKIYGGDDNDHLYGDFINEERKGDNGDAEDNIYGGDGDDHIYGGGGDDDLYGEDDKDTIYGGSGSDEIHGGDGRDILYGDYETESKLSEIDKKNSHDTIYGGKGGDHLYGGSGTDQLYGGDERDIMYGDYEGDTAKGERDYLYGEDGNDDLHGGGGNDKLCGGDGLDNIFGDGGDDEIYGDEDDYGNPTGDSNSDNYKDTIAGGLGEDTIYGGSGDDIIYGDNLYNDTVGDKDIISGGYGSDKIHGGGGDDELYGGAKNAIIPSKFDKDFIYGGSGADYIEGGTGIDYLYGNIFDVHDDDGARDILYGGIDVDYYFVSRNDIIVDIDGNGYVEVNGHLLVGGSRRRGEEGYFIGEDDNYIYRIINGNTIEVTIPDGGGTVLITSYGNFQLKSGMGFEEIYHQLNITLKETWDEDPNPDVPLKPCPIIIDLNPEKDVIGINRANVHFDMDKDGSANRTEWVSPTDGLLSYDENGNGKIDNVSELFGNYEYLNGFEKLKAEFDSNKDGMIDNNDELFEKLRVWIDSNSDGITQEGELKQLADLGIKGISLNYTPNNTGDVIAYGSYIKEDGTTGNATDYLFDISKSDTKFFIDGGIPEEIKNLPNLAGSGLMEDLHTAMALDPDLKSFVEANFNDYQSIAANFDKLIVKWSGLEQKGYDINILSKGGAYWVLGRRNSSQIEDAIINYSRPLAWNQYLALKEMLVVELLLQTYEGVEFLGGRAVITSPDLFWKDMNMEFNQNYNMGLVILSQLYRYGYLDCSTTEKPADFDYDLDTILPNFNNTYVFASNEGHKEIADRGGFDQLVINWGIKNEDLWFKFDDSNLYVGVKEEGKSFEELVNILTLKNFFREGFIETIIIPDGRAIQGEMFAMFMKNNIGDSYSWYGEGLLAIGNDGNDTINMAYFNDTIVGGRGNDVLNGGEGDDTYIFNRGDGHDTIKDESGFNRIVFGDGITSDDLYARFIGAYFVIAHKEEGKKFEECSDKISILNHNMGELIFSDGTILDLADMMNLLGTEGSETIYWKATPLNINAGDGDDDIWVGDFNNIIIGGRGNEEISAGKGDDTYIFNRGDGHDLIYDDGGIDTIVFGEGITVEDIYFEPRTFYHGAKIAIKGTEDCIEIAGGGSFNKEIEFLKFADGTIYSYSNLELYLFNGVSYGGENYFWREQSLYIHNLANSKGTLNIGEVTNDFYIFGKGYGRDSVKDAIAIDEMLFVGVTKDDLIFKFDGASNLMIGIKEGNKAITSVSDRVTIENFCNSGRFSSGRIEKFSFLDGSILTVAEIVSQLGTDGNDNIVWKTDVVNIDLKAGNDSVTSGDMDDTLIGGKGNDILKGGGGNDTYIFNYGDGKDTINDTSGDDRILFGEGITKNDLIFNVDSSGNLLVGLKETGKTIDKVANKVTIENFISGGVISDGRIEWLVFADGSKMGLEEILEGLEINLIIPAPIISVSKTAIVGTDGDDEINIVGNTDDIIICGKGTDYLNGGAGNDVYIINLGDGNKRISDGEGINTLHFGEGISLDDLYYFQDMWLHCKILAIMHDDGSYDEIYYDKIEYIEFSDGTKYPLSLIFNTYFDLVYMSADIVGTDGDDILYDGNSPIFLCGKGNDKFIIKYINTTFLYNRGDGKDTVDIQNYMGSGKVIFGAGITEADIIVKLDGANLTIGLKEEGKTIDTISDSITFKNYWNGLVISFMDNDTILYSADIVSRLGTDAADSITWSGSVVNLNTGAGNDTINSGDFNDTLTGGIGADTLKGGGGDDTYIFNRGDGKDTINDTAGNDRILFGQGITKDDLLFKLDGTANLIIGLKEDGKTIANVTDKITIEKFRAS
jgi:Ca2+-binding RTX toxin-like protein